MDDDDAILVLCTVPDAEVAERLGRGLVEASLAACVNAVPGVRSFYSWKGELQDDAEVQLLIKSRRGRATALEAWLADHHPYEVPEILFVPIAGGSADYLGWLRAQTR
jgi:periplasmic divalent cation tolerance protein